MRIGGSLFLIALGAVLKFAVTDAIGGVDLGMVGVILMIVGAVGLVLSLILATRRQRTDIVHEPGPVYATERPGYGQTAGGRTTYVEPAERDPRL